MVELIRINPATPLEGKMSFNILATVAEFEVDLLRMRYPRRHGHRPGQAQAQSRAPKLPTDRQAHLLKLHAAGEHTIVELAELFGVSRQTVYRVLERCTCRQLRPGCSSGMFVLVEDAGEAVTSVDAQVGEPVRIGDRFGQWGQWPGVRDALMCTVGVVEDLELRTAWSRCRWLKTSVRSSSSWRQVRTQRSMIAFIRGTRTPLPTIVMPESARTWSKPAGYLKLLTE